MWVLRGSPGTLASAALSHHVVRKSNQPTGPATGEATGEECRKGSKTHCSHLLFQLQPPAATQPSSSQTPPKLLTHRNEEKQ